MSKYRVTTTVETTRVVEAENPFQAAMLVGGNVTDVRPARGRLSGATSAPAATNTVNKVAKKRRPLSPEARAKLAQNLVKARAARAQNMKAAKKVSTKRAPAKRATKTTRKTAKKA